MNDWLKNILSFGAQGSTAPFGALGAPQSSVGPAANNGLPLNMAAPMPAQSPGQPPGLWGALLSKLNPNAQQNGQDPNSSQPNQNNQNDALRAQVLGQAVNLIQGPQIQPAQWMQMRPMGTMR
jgi:hypothetical protein